MNAAMAQKLTVAQKRLAREHVKQLQSLLSQLSDSKARHVQRRVDASMRRLCERVIPVIENTIRDGVALGDESGSLSKASRVARAGALIRGSAYGVPPCSLVRNKNRVIAEKMGEDIRVAIHNRKPIREAAQRWIDAACECATEALCAEAERAYKTSQSN